MLAMGVLAMGDPIDDRSEVVVVGNIASWCSSELQPALEASAEPWDIRAADGRTFPITFLIAPRARILPLSQIMFLYENLLFVVGSRIVALPWKVDGP